MLIDCPYCGSRPSEEFTYLGDASLVRPAIDATMDAWLDYVYLRDNPKGRMHEYWHHGGGCRSWLVLERDTLTHEIFGTMTARDWAAHGKGRS
jgi:heterotetrameric sarcosine oxidase delta subunit